MTTSVLTMTCWSEGMNSRAFWMTLHPYICRASDSTWPRILSARASFWSRLPNWNTQNKPVNPLSHLLINNTLLHTLHAHPGHKAHENQAQFARIIVILTWISSWWLKSSLAHFDDNDPTFHTHLKELLDDVISEDIHHELVGSLQYLTEDKLALRWTGSLQLQLDKPWRGRQRG